MKWVLEKYLQQRTTIPLSKQKILFLTTTNYFEQKHVSKNIKHTNLIGNIPLHEFQRNIIMFLQAKQVPNI